jgi:hypothetical protein
MKRYFCITRFIERSKNKYPKITKLIICFDSRKLTEKTNYNQLKLHLYGIVIELDSKKYALDYAKLVELCNSVDGCDIIENDTYEIIITISEGKNKILNFNKTFQLLDIATELKAFKTKDKKVIDYFPSSILNTVSNNTNFNEMINKKKEFMSKGFHNENLDDIKFI